MDKKHKKGTPENHSKNQPPWNIFSQRIRSASLARRTLPYKPVATGKKHACLDALLRQHSATGNRVIYVHVPFCKTICDFCIYTKQVAENEKTKADWSNTLLEQIKSVSVTKWAQSAPFQAIYFGGGTPTAIPVKKLTEIIQTLKKL